MKYYRSQAWREIVDGRQGVLGLHRGHLRRDCFVLYTTVTFNSIKIRDTKKLLNIFSIALLVQIVRISQAVEAVERLKEMGFETSFISNTSQPKPQNGH